MWRCAVDAHWTGCAMDGRRLMAGNGLAIDGRYHRPTAHGVLNACRARRSEQGAGQTQDAQKAEAGAVTGTHCALTHTHTMHTQTHTDTLTHNTNVRSLELPAACTARKGSWEYSVANTAHVTALRLDNFGAHNATHHTHIHPHKVPTSRLSRLWRSHATVAQSFATPMVHTLSRHTADLIACLLIDRQVKRYDFQEHSKRLNELDEDAQRKKRLRAERKAQQRCVCQPSEGGGRSADVGCCFALSSPRVSSSFFLGFLIYSLPSSLALPQSLPPCPPPSLAPRPSHPDAVCEIIIPSLSRSLGSAPPDTLANWYWSPHCVRVPCACGVRCLLCRREKEEAEKAEAAAGADEEMMRMMGFSGFSTSKR